MKHNLSAKEQAISRIFSDDYVFSVPGYQRPYSWGTEQARELLGDLLGYMRSNSINLEDMAPYFLGSIVLIKEEGNAKATVVDGQQRLTTLTLLLSAIRATVDDVGIQTGITKRIYEHGDVVTATPAMYRLSLRDRDREFFRQYVQHEDGISTLADLNAKLPDAQDRLRTNARLFLEELGKLNQDTLKKLVQFIATRCYLVTVATPDLDSAYRIFGILNSRGLDLSATDILKAEIIGAIPGGKRDDYTRKWEGIEESLGRDAFSELFSHIRMVYRKTKPQGTLLKEFRDHVGPAEPIAFIDQVLEPMADAFTEISDADFSSQRHAETINQSLKWLNRIEFKDWMPPALIFFSTHRNDPEEMLRFFADLERLAYTMLVRKSGVNERIDRFSKLTAAIESGANLYVADSPLQLSPKEQQQTYLALAGPIYDTHSARQLSVILLRLDGLLSDGKATYDQDVVTIEHVLPQTPKNDSEWIAWIPGDQVREQWIHRLGNLALLSRKKNSSASNWDFDRKKNTYFKKGGVSSFALTTQVLSHVQWTTSVLEQRQQELLSLLEHQWRLLDRTTMANVEFPTASASSAAPVVFELESAKHQITASAHEVDGRFFVLAGSGAKSTWSGQEHSYSGVRQDLIYAGKLLPQDNGSYAFSEDVEFSSPSAASAVILGRTDNGRQSWVVATTGQTYAEWRDGVEVEPEPAKKGERQRILHAFWSQFIERSKATTPLFANRSPTHDHWLSTGIGRHGFNINVVLTRDEGRVECFLRIPKDNGERTKKAFDSLHTRKEEIEAAFGGSLDWKRLDDRSGSRICTEIPGGWKLDESHWGSFQDELARLSNRLTDALRGPIQDI